MRHATIWQEPERAHTPTAWARGQHLSSQRATTSNPWRLENFSIRIMMKLQATTVSIPAEATSALIDWPELRRERRVIVVVDVVESVRLMQADEADVIDRWRRFVNDVRTQLLPKHGGRLVKSLGDGLLLEFETVPAAVAASFEMQHQVGGYNAGRDSLKSMALRVGVHLTDIVFDDLDIYGAGVNLSARLASLSLPGGIVVSAPVRDSLIDGIDADMEDMGDCYVKHLSDPVRAFRLHSVGVAQGKAPKPAVAADVRPSVAVLPLIARGAAQDLGVVGDVFADEVCISLARCSELKVTSRLSTCAFKNRVEQASAHELLKVHYVVSGSYHLDGGQARIRVELCDANVDEVLWADSANLNCHALLSAQEPAVEAMVASISAAIVAREVQCATSNPLPNVQSHALMSASITLMHRSNRPQFDRARSMLDHLRERHPSHPQPHAWLAKWHVLSVVQGWSADPQRDGQRALDAGHRALDSDSHSSLALTMQGLVHAYLLRDFDKASDAYGDALRINPNESMAMLLLGTMHAFLGAGEPAWDLTQASLRLSPLDPLRYFYLSLSASAAISAKRYDEAADLAQRSLRANRTHLSTYRALALAQALSGKLPQARQTIDEMLKLEPGFTTSAFLARYPGRDRAPEYTALLADAFRSAGLPD